MLARAKSDGTFARRYVPVPPQPPSVLADLYYVAPSSETLYNYMYEPADGSPQHNCAFERHTVSIADARAHATGLSVHGNGFELWEVPSEIKNFRDNEEVRRIYYGECAALACAATGGKQGYVFDHQVRKREAGRPPLTFGCHGDGSSPAAAGRIHNDYSERSGHRRLAVVLGDAGEKEVERYCIVNIWRSIAGPIVDTPLALCDAESINARDLQASEVRYTDRTGEIYLVAHSSRHRWFYYSHMDRREALVFKQYDSQVSGVARYTPHTAFDLPDIPADAPLRESIEVRFLVIMD